MKTLHPPEAWRSEAFAEDFISERVRRGRSRWRAIWVAAGLGALPLALAVAGAVLSLLPAAA